jgi:hypothetical protein
MKKLLQFVVCIVFHPIGTILVWIQLSKRNNMSDISKIVIAVLAIIPFVPLIYAIFNDLW